MFNSYVKLPEGMWENYIGESEDPSTLAALAEFWRLKKTWRIESEHSSLLSF